MSLENCTHDGWGVHNCAHYKDVSILCGNGTLYEWVYCNNNNNNNYYNNNYYY